MSDAIAAYHRAQRLRWHQRPAGRPSLEGTFPVAWRLPCALVVRLALECP